MSDPYWKAYRAEVKDAHQGVRSQREVIPHARKRKPWKLTAIYTGPFGKGMRRISVGRYATEEDAQKAKVSYERNFGERLGRGEAKMPAIYRDFEIEGPKDAVGG